MTTQVKLLKDFMWWMLFVGFLGYCGRASAQVLPEYSAFPKTSIGVQLGTQGIGLQGTSAFGRMFNARIGFNTVPDITVQYNGRDLGLNRTSVYGIVDWQPMYGNTDWLSRKWYVSAGISYYFNNTLYREGSRHSTQLLYLHVKAAALYRYGAGQYAVKPQHWPPYRFWVFYSYKFGHINL
jgi:hypothetical protein